MKFLGDPARLLLVSIALTLAGCGGGSSNSPAATQPPPAPPPAPPPTPPPTPTLDPQYVASGTSPFAANCDGEAALGTVYINAEVEPSLAINPANTLSMAAVWQEDRWSTGGARGIVAGASTDGGKTWTRRAMPFTRCAGGTAANGGDYPRTSNPWITASPDGTLNQLALAFDGGVLQAGSVSAVLAARSTDGGVTWGPTQTLIRDVNDFFNDKGAITADPQNARYIYAVWDRLTSTNLGPSEFTRSIDGGVTWEAPRPIYDPGVNNQTISNAIVILPNGTLVDCYLEIDGMANGSFTSFLAAIHSTDNGLTWSAPVKIADNFSIGTHDPETGTLVRDSSLVPEIAVGIGGSLAAVWQDSRFTNGARDSIALSRSTDGGATWSTPVRVNSNAATPAFTPNVHMRGDGMIGVSYYDFRSNTSDAATLYTDFWLSRSTDGVAWQESQIGGPFDLDLAPFTTSPAPGGYFLGDYQALQSIGNTFVPMFMQTNAGNANNRTDVFVAPAVSAVSSALLTANAQQISAAQTTTADLQQRVGENIVRQMQWRVPGWHSARLPQE